MDSLPIVGSRSVFAFPFLVAITCDIIFLDQVNDENRAELLKILQEFSDQIPRAFVPRRLALTVATGKVYLSTSQAGV